MQLENIYNGDGPVATELKRFLSDAVSQKAIRLSEKDAQTQFPLLLQEGLIAPDGRGPADATHSIANHPLLYYGFYQEFNKRKGFKYAPDIEKLLSFHKSVADYFLIDGRCMSGYLEHGFSAFLLLMGDKPALGLIFEQGKALLKESPYFLTFYRAIFDNPTHWNQTFTAVWDMILAFGTMQGKLDQSAPGNLWPKILPIFHQYFLSQQANLHQYRDIVISKFGGDPIEDYLAGISLQIIHQLVVTPTEEVITMMETPALFTISIVLLTRCPTLENSQIETICGYLKNIQVDSRTFPEAVKLVITILSSGATLITDQKLFFEGFIARGVESTDKNVVIQTIQIFSFGIQLTELLSGLLLNLFNGGKYKDDYTEHISGFYNFHKSIPDFFEFLYKYSIYKGLSFDPYRFKDAIYLLHEDDKSGFEYHIIKMMTDDQGQVRYAGLRLLLSLKDYCRQGDITFDLHSLNPLEQYKFIITLVNDRLHGKEQLTFIIPLLSSSSPIVRELAICKIEEAFLGYNQRVFEYLSGLISGLAGKQEIEDRIKEVLRQVDERFKLKKDIREFLPEVQYPRLARAYKQHSKKMFQDSSQKQKHKADGLLGLIKPVAVGRRGGSLHPDGNISGYHTSSVTFTLPSTIFLKPETEEFELSVFFNSNWSEDFKPWERTILSSGTI
ncbi:hypothetical protein [Chitinophaga sp. W2I13]|uniref:hypothetical protein n=1 Tax=Chitinophaga sp. W2I13 TaxID=3373923 RepID=UPI003D1C73B0